MLHKVLKEVEAQCREKRTPKLPCLSTLPLLYHTKNVMRTYLALGWLPFVLCGCLSIAAQNTVRVDSGMTESYEMSESGIGTIQKWLLPEKRSISRIEIYFDSIEPLNNMTVYARRGENDWRIVKATKTPVRQSPYIIQTPLFTDGIRIVLSSSLGMVDRIVLYGAEAQLSFE